MQQKELRETLICKCGSLEHMIHFWIDEDGEVYLYVHLVPEQNIFKRIKNAVKYIFGHRSRYGEFDEFMFSDKHIVGLEKILQHIKTLKENGEH